MLTKEEALRKHREMWTAMQKALGNKPTAIDRLHFKQDWCKAHGDADITAHCYLCQYVDERGLNCDDCPIDWNGQTTCFGDVHYKRSPISEILALPERKVNDAGNS